MDKGNLLAYMGGIVRIATTLLGGYLAQKGLATEAETEGLVGAGVVVATGIWSIWAKRKALAKVPPKAVGAVSVLLCALMLGASGCLTRTRCQALTFDGCTFNVNEPVGVDDPKYPRSLQIGVNDQQIEGGTDVQAHPESVHGRGYRDPPRRYRVKAGRGAGRVPLAAALAYHRATRERDTDGRGTATGGPRLAGDDGAVLPCQREDVAGDHRRASGDRPARGRREAGGRSGGAGGAEHGGVEEGRGAGEEDDGESEGITGPASWRQPAEGS